MVYFKCSACSTRLYGMGSRTGAVGDLCPSCGALLEPVGELSEVVGFRSITPRESGAPGRHQRIADHVDGFLSRRRRFSSRHGMTPSAGRDTASEHAASGPGG